ncbi:hypothetical protein [Bacillus sp. SG-1]|uniref:hypothetical protein n=1 Tax=Bacillus sp. SG-1 TaxID=161544 RepID=UPI0001543A8E|nr:hypothetical protein [Bacillus sp. SG-1]EDL65310.1 hypothetical protein BSG1_10078 [Bacillus sp. SG-1]
MDIGACLQLFESIDALLIIGLIISVLVNMYQYFQLKRYQMNDSSYKAKWQEVMGLDKPLNVLLWLVLTLWIVIGVPMALYNLFN